MKKKYENINPMLPKMLVKFLVNIFMNSVINK